MTVKKGAKYRNTKAAIFKARLKFTTEKQLIKVRRHARQRVSQGKDWIYLDDSLQHKITCSHLANLVNAELESRGL